MTASVSKGLVIIVDDDAAVRDSLKILLEAHGLEVEDFATTSCFAERFRNGAGRPAGPTCLVLDHDLPATTGLAFLTSGHVARLPPVLFVTGRGNNEIAARALAAGAAAFFEKPVADAQLVRAIFELLDLQHARADT